MPIFMPCDVAGPGRGDEVLERVRQRGGVAGIVPADHLVQQGRVQHGARDRADLVQRGGHGDGAVAGDAAVGGLDADRAGDGAGLADRSAGVGAEGQRGFERRDGGSGAAARAAGDAVQVPRVVGGAVRGVLGGGAHGELVQVGLAQDRHLGGAQALDDGGVVGAAPAFEDLRAGRGGLADRDDEVLDRDRHAREDVQLLGGGAARGADRVHFGGDGEGLVRVDVQEGVNLTVDGGDPVQVRLRDLDGGDFAGGQFFGERGGGEADQFVVSHGLSPHPGLPGP